MSFLLFACWVCRGDVAFLSAFFFLVWRCWVSVDLFVVYSVIIIVYFVIAESVFSLGVVVHAVCQAFV